MMGGRLLGIVPPPHTCDPDVNYTPLRGQVWECECGKRFIYQPSMYGLVWKRISRWRSDRLLRKATP